MDTIFRVVTWNCLSTTTRPHRSGVWDYLLEMDPDVALLQEVRSIPEKVGAVYEYQMKQATNEDGSLQEFSTALLVKGRIENKLSLPSHEKWIEEELQRFSGNLVAFEILPDNGPPMKAVSVYGPAWPVDRKRLSGIDVTGVRLKLQKHDVWVMDLLWASLKYQRQDLDQPWIIGGDFNLSETFDSWRSGPRGNREYLDRMRELGLLECLRQSQGRLTPTYRHPRGDFKDQIDHLFVSPVLAERLVSCDTGSFDRVFNPRPRLSDHLPIVADFRL